MALSPALAGMICILIAPSTPWTATRINLSNNLSQKQTFRA